MECVYLSQVLGSDLWCWIRNQHERSFPARRSILSNYHFRARVKVDQLGRKWRSKFVHCKRPHDVLGGVLHERLARQIIGKRRQIAGVSQRKWEHAREFTKF